MALSVEEQAAGAVDVILKDGGTLRLRPPAAADEEAVLAFLAGLSERSLYLRFHGIRQVDSALAASMLEPDWAETGALAGWLGDRVVGLANYVRLRDPSTAEAAFVVADDEQGRGIGMRLLEQLAARAAETGVSRFVAEVMAENRAMLSVFTGAGFDVVRELEHGEVEVSFPIAATETLQARVEQRDHVAVAASLRPFFEPASVAVIGASRRRGSIGGELFRNVLEADFAGAAYPVNRGGEPVAGVRGYGSINEIPDEIELAVICVPGPRVLEAAEEALAKGVRALCVISSGFAETGEEGRERQEQLLALVRAHGARLLGPNCLGIASTKPKLNATFAPRALPAGRIGFSSQSGALGLALLEQSSTRLGFSAFVSIGNKADVSSNDLLEWWEDDPDTDVVLLYLESFGNPRKFARLSRRIARRKPILALKAGATAAGAKAASSHTAALAGSEAAVDALFDQAGVVRARTLEELVDVAGPALEPAAPARPARGRAHERGRARDPLRRRVRGRGPGAAGPGSGDARGPGGGAAGRRQRRQPGRHARLGDRRDLRARASAAARRPAPRRADRPLCPAGRRGRAGGGRPRSGAGWRRPRPTSRCSPS